MRRDIDAFTNPLLLVAQTHIRTSANLPIAYYLLHSPTLPLVSAKLAKKTSDDGIKYMQWLEIKKISDHFLFRKEFGNRNDEGKLHKCFQ